MSGFEVAGFISAAAISTALNSLWLGLLILVLAAGVVRLLPRPSAATRHAIWLIALVLVVATSLMLLIPRPAAPSMPLAVPGAVPPLTVPSTVVWPIYAALAWLAIAAILLGRVAWSLLYIHGLKSRAALFGRRDSIRVLVSPEVRAPMAAGFLHRAIIFPQRWIAELQPQEFEQVLCHEMAHLRRWDDWTQLLQEVVRAVFFFNPASHWIGRRLAMEREMACDDWVVSSTGEARPYAACLTHLHELMRRPHARLSRAPEMAPGATSGKRRQITTRVEALLRPDRNGAPRFARSGWIAAGALASAALLVAARTTPLVGVQQFPLATMAVALPAGPAVPPISLLPRAKAAVRPRLLARRAGPVLPAPQLALRDYILPVRAWEVEVSPRYFVITVVFFEPPPPAALNGI
ncbi:MAG TPA: M56 family metallopeptidase [Bryobacteraceae bacterium]|nr:M56 family metallopeptidase [Bryobacteraceae bacterium]